MSNTEGNTDPKDSSSSISINKSLLPIPFPLPKILYKKPDNDYGTFDALEKVGKNSGAGFLLGSLLSWSRYTDPRSLAKNSSLASTPVGQQQLMNQIALKGAQAAAMAGVFTSILEISKWFDFENKELITYSLAGFTTGAIGAVFIKPFQFKTLTKQSLLMAGIAGLYTKIEEFNASRRDNSISIKNRSDSGIVENSMSRDSSDSSNSDNSSEKNS